VGQPNCFGVLQCAASRFSSLTGTGAPNTGNNNGYVTTNLMSADVKADIEKGADETIINALNNVCQEFRDCDRLKSIDLTIEVCSLEPDLLNLLLGGVKFTSPGSGVYSAAQSGRAVGLQFPLPTDPCNNGVCVEFWQLAWDSSSQATSSLFTATSLTYVHWVFPKILFQISDFKISDKFTTFKLNGIARVNPKITANGPFDDWDLAVANAGGVTGLGGFFYDDEFPAAACNLINVPSAAS
jgi:hypothetical protein